MGDDSTMLEISPTGDIILVVGPAEDKQLRLRVSSTILRSASKVFDAMFSPPWLESSRIFSPESPQDIELPEDDPTAMETICYALHHRNDKVEFDPSGPHILQAARAIDKYDMDTAMELVVDRWFSQAVPDNDPSEYLMYLLATSVVLKKHLVFHKLTWLIMINHKESYRPFQQDQLLSESLPSQLLLTLAERSGQLRHLLHQTILEAAFAPLAPSPCCDEARFSEELKSIFKTLRFKYFPVLVESVNLQSLFQGTAMAPYTPLEIMKALVKPLKALKDAAMCPRHFTLFAYPRIPDFDEMERQFSICPHCLEADFQARQCHHGMKVRFNGAIMYSELERAGQLLVKGGN